MKKILVAMACLGMVAFTSCKKDRVCECTNTNTSSSGNVTTDLNVNTSYTDIKKSDAKSICQKSTSVHVNSSGGTSTYVSDCKLK